MKCVTVWVCTYNLSILYNCSLFKSLSANIKKS